MRKITLLKQARERLFQAGIEDAAFEANLLLCWACGCTRMELLQRDIIPDGSVEKFQMAIQRRSAREPVAFIIGEQGFWTLDLHVSPETLIPRGDSETLLEALLHHRPDRQAVRSVLDLGTGTGCLLLAALTEYPQAWGLGVDVAPGAAALARRNARRNGLSERTAFVAGDWATAIRGQFDVVLSNPPYIEHADMAHLMPDVVEYEPHRALDGGDDGLVAYRILCRSLPHLLSETGCAVLELGVGQEKAVTALAEAAGLKVLECRKDLGGVGRALVLAFS
ncbi:peptide chain release factor N(5)-glutamine methyltransferase [Bombella sp. TMW 2.2543]|uniref:Release factor glutamine methyltransferase n=1 Tax=Bombella pluederhausensis TaxID=2967336 RepID=A0ABT3WFB3_9PROT|nr:peptide chain release factor N(5)-glutamine methyltransferase [Bombella pluederhausensis]MCX5617802.1 peptide chain release factor N(5)-glutamine methyltransferase [Bombella pluederhausensis]